MDSLKPKTDKKIKSKEKIKQEAKESILQKETPKEESQKASEIKAVKKEKDSSVLESILQDDKDKELQRNEQKSENSSKESFQKESVRLKSDMAKSKVKLQHTLNTFAQEFKEKVDSYKPPIMRVKMTLNPKNLGEVDVTIVNRGNNLQVSINSNPTTMSIFTQNQAEFKAALVNMGFSELNMSFGNNNQKNNQNQNQNKNRYYYGSENESEQEEITTLEITLPRYG